ncbi:MAG: LppX_LprAFG lipoprotein [Ilumatobacter sp.]|uniref:LppX_LprAFG lipoprotein n=1 Tax=Ilumatobacter sp. TaxID=1967498 RepID=UPI00260BF588|nr:LppX_LprAFG lipoprotein [Ilumatobacter sp.]MDJ0771567.1 LppX_LprAFG lipoprotein [Ilumatobacter sp.]
MATRKRDGTTVFAAAAVAAAAVALVVTLVLASGALDGDDGDVAAADEVIVDLDDGAVADPAADPAAVVASAADAMAAVTSVEFELERSGAPIFIDEFESLALDRLLGQFTVPSRAQAELTITVDGDLPTKIGAVAIDEEVWISNPVTGDFETLPAGFDIDPSRFFDPEDGWRPLLANLLDVELVGVDDRGGDRYHIRGTAPAAEVRNITVGLVTGQDVPVDLWVHPTTGLVTAAEFTTVIDGGESNWQLELADYGAAFTIDPPENVRA